MEQVIKRMQVDVGVLMGTVRELEREKKFYRKAFEDIIKDQFVFSEANNILADRLDKLENPKEPTFEERLQEAADIEEGSKEPFKGIDQMHDEKEVTYEEEMKDTLTLASQEQLTSLVKKPISLIDKYNAMKSKKNKAVHSSLRSPIVEDRKKKYPTEDDGISTFSGTLKEPSKSVMEVLNKEKISIVPNEFGSSNPYDFTLMEKQELEGEPKALTSKAFCEDRMNYYTEGIDRALEKDKDNPIANGIYKMEKMAGRSTNWMRRIAIREEMHNIINKKLTCILTPELVESLSEEIATLMSKED